MTDIDNPILTMLRAMRDDISDIRTRVTNLEQGIASVQQGIAHHAAVAAQVQVSIDRLSTRVKRIEQRLPLVDPAT